MLDKVNRMCDTDSVMRANINILTYPTRLSKARIVIHLIAQGDPLSKNRPRFALNKGGTVYTPKETKEAEEAIAWQIKANSPTLFCDKETLFGVRLIFYQATYQRRDIDNMVKLVLDACTGIVWQDDNQVVEINAYKFPNVGNELARTEICVYKTGSLENEFATCLYCGKRFRTHPSWRKVHRGYCSRLCSSSAQRKRTKGICLQCGKEFEYPIIQSFHRKFCSRLCRQRHQQFARRSIRCKNCGKIFAVPPGRKRPIYCSEDCRIGYIRNQPNKTPKTQQGICLECGKPTSKKKYTICLACSLAKKKFRYRGKRVLAI